MLILDAGNILYNPKTIRSNKLQSNRLKAATLAQGYERVGCDALNVGVHDLALGFTFMDSLAKKFSLPFISANIVDGNNKPVFETYKIINRGGLNIGIIGLTDKIPDAAVGLKAKDYIKTGQQLISQLRPEVDVIVLLINGNRKDHNQWKKEFPEADYIFTSGYTGRTYPSTPQTEGGPYLYSVGVQGKWVAEIELSMVNMVSPVMDISQSKATLKTVEKRFESLQKRNPDMKLEDIYADNPNVLKIISKYRVQEAKAKLILDEAVNTSEYKLTALDKKISDDNYLFELVADVLKETRKLDRSDVKRSVIKKATRK